MPPTQAANWCQAAHLLEEPRIEAVQVTHRPGDRRWLRTTVSKLILDEFTALGTPDEAGSATAPFLARENANILESAETPRAACALADATTATVLFGEDVHALSHPGHNPARVTDFAAPTAPSSCAGPSTPLTARSACPSPAPPGGWSSSPT